MSGIKGKQLDANTVTAAQVDTSSGTIATINAGDAAVEGAGSGLARRDHQHAVATGSGTAAIEVGDSAGEGSSSDLARADHVHPVAAPSAPVNVDKSAAGAGSAVTVARSDHKHDVSTGIPIAIGASLAQGSASSLARSDHQHTHGNQAGGSLHADSTISTAGFMSATDKIKLDTLQDAAGVDAKESCRIRTIADDTLSGLADRDGVTPLAGDRILADSQSTATEDGIYIAAAGAWARSVDMAVGTEARGSLVHIEEGSQADRLYQCVNNAGSDVVGTDGLSFAQIGAGSPRGAGDGLVLNANDLDVVANADGSIVVSANDVRVGTINDTQHGTRGGGTQHAVAVAAGAAGFMTGADKSKLDGVTALAAPNSTSRQERVTTQTIINSDTALTDVLNFTPISNASLLLLFNGVALIQGAGEDYTVSGNIITWLADSGTAKNLATSDDLVAYYLS